MKTRFFFPALVASATFLFSAVVNAQFTASNLRSAQHQPATFKSDATADAIALASLKTVNEKMHKHFSRNFKDAQNISIRSVQNEVRVNYTMDGVNSCSQYDSKGRWLFSIAYYPESKLDSDTRQIVESAYPGFLVSGTVAEIKVPGNSGKLVMIENKREWKRILLTADDMKVYEAYKKQ
jgi:hypothetical protein